MQAGHLRGDVRGSADMTEPLTAENVPIQCVRRTGCLHLPRCQNAGCCTLAQPDAIPSNERTRPPGSGNLPAETALMVLCAVRNEFGSIMSKGLRKDIHFAIELLQHVETPAKHPDTERLDWMDTPECWLVDHNWGSGKVRAVIDAARGAVKTPVCNCGWTDDGQSIKRVDPACRAHGASAPTRPRDRFEAGKPGVYWNCPKCHYMNDASIRLNRCGGCGEFQQSHQSEGERRE
jgi:hypothetical protein